MKAIIGNWLFRAFALVVMFFGIQSPVYSQDLSLANVSVQGEVSETVGLTIHFTVGEEGGTKTFLIRGVGPGLNDFGLKGVPNPILSVLSKRSNILTVNDDWEVPIWDAHSVSGTWIAEYTKACGAFPLKEGSKDAAMIARLPPGVYSASVFGRESSGRAILEIYDLSLNGKNIGPSKPKIEGPFTVFMGDKITLRLTSIDLDGDPVRFWIDLTGDMKVEGITDFVKSGAPMDIVCWWKEPGSYTISVMPEDKYGNLGPIAQLKMKVTGF